AVGLLIERLGVELHRLRAVRVGQLVGAREQAIVRLAAAAGLGARADRVGRVGPGRAGVLAGTGGLVAVLVAVLVPVLWRERIGLGDQRRELVRQRLGTGVLGLRGEDRIDERLGLGRLVLRREHERLVEPRPHVAGGLELAVALIDRGERGL